MISGDVPLNANFALNETLLGAIAVMVSALTKFDDYSICIAIFTNE